MPIAIWVQEGEERTEAYRDVLDDDGWLRVPPIRLERWAGRTVSLGFETGATRSSGAGLVMSAPVVRRCDPERPE